MSEKSLPIDQIKAIVKQSPSNIEDVDMNPVSLKEYTKKIRDVCQEID